MLLLNATWQFQTIAAVVTLFPYEKKNKDDHFGHIHILLFIQGHHPQKKSIIGAVNHRFSQGITVDLVITTQNYLFIG